MEQTVTWLNQEFYIRRKSDNWKEIAGVYIFTGVNQQNLWVALYVGLADNLRTRLANHERWDEAVALGATHVHARVVPLAADRDQLEQALIRSYHPPLNTQHRFPSPPRQ